MEKMRISIYVLGMTLMLAACSTTSSVPEGDQLFVGLSKIEYKNYEKGKHFTSVQEEVEAALATAPNGALFGSSYYRTPFPYSLWIWNAFSDKESKTAQWITKNFGKQPVLMSWVNPALRASVAQSMLRSHGYFHSQVGYDAITQKNPKKAKIGYSVNMGHLFTLDSIRYVNFPGKADSLIEATKTEAKIQTGDPFDVTTLDAERQRLTTLFRNNGYYYYQNGYASYLADTMAVPGKVQVRLQMADSLPPQATHKWYIGKVSIEMRKRMMQQLTDSFQHRHFTVRFNGRRPPIRPRVIMSDLRLRPRQQYSYENYLESVNKINAKGLYSMVDFKFTPRDSSETCDTLDLTLSCVFDRPYDVYFEGNLRNKTLGRLGPQLVLGFTKRNAFRGGEKLDVNLHGSYEWETSGGSSKMNSYEYGIGASLEFPRIVAPFFGGNSRRVTQSGQRRRRRFFYNTPTTLLKVSNDVLNRPSYFNMNTLSAEWIYKWQTSAVSKHEFSPLTIQYQHLNRTTATFDSLLLENRYLELTMRDMFIPKMRYTYSYSSPARKLNPIKWETTITEAGNLVSLGLMVGGRKWGEQDKRIYKNAYAQFLKLETDFTKTWTLGTASQLVGHLNAGILFAYGNSETAPYSEQFYAGGANSIRAFTIRRVGPGSYMSPTAKKNSYLDQTGDMKFIFNLEYRQRLFDNVYGALFLDGGNVWTVKEDEHRPGSKFKFGELDKMALGTGVGLRYDLDFLVLRLDWGIGLHLPYETDKSGFYNISKFSDAQSIHFAVGYPF